MVRSRSVIVRAACLFLAAPLLAQSVCDVPEPAIEQKEEFLKTAKILRTRQLSEGITNSLRATLSDGKCTHDAHIQSIDEYKNTFVTATGTELNFKDTYKGNIAGYRLDKIMRLGMIPPSVERKYAGRSAAFTWWVDDVLMTEKQRYQKGVEPPDRDRWNLQMYIVRVFDQLIYNTDRNLGNLLILKNWDLRMIDHTRAFRLYDQLRDDKNLVRCDRQFLDRLRKLDEPTLMRELTPYLTRPEIKAVLARRDRIVAFFEKAIATQGEAAVLYDFLPPAS
jgi:hypothetical protein